MASLDQKTKYSLYCNNEDAARFTPFRTDAEGEPTICPVCSSEDIKDIAIQQQINKGEVSGEEEDEYKTTNNEWATRVSASKAGMQVGDKVKVYWYAEVRKFGSANVKARVQALGTQHDTTVATCSWNIYMYRPFAGTAIFEAEFAEDVTFALQIASQTNGQEIGIRRARIWTEELPEGS